MATRVSKSARSCEGTEIDRLPALGVYKWREVGRIARLRSTARRDARAAREASGDDHGCRQAGWRSSMKLKRAFLFLLAPAALAAQQPTADTTKPAPPP